MRQSGNQLDSALEWDLADTRQSTSDAPALALEGVGFGYERVPVVRDVTAAFQAGEMAALLGPNGAGKSTLLRVASGLARPTAGRVLLEGADLASLPRREVARRVAVVPQEFSVQFPYTVRQLVELGRAPHQGLFGLARARDREVVTEALAATGVAMLADRVFNELSGGERQRVILALALAQEPHMLLLDEPTAHLDIKHQIEVLELLRQLNRERGLTVLAVLHDLNLAARFFPRLLLLRGALIDDGPPSRVLESGVLSRVYETPVRVGILRGEAHLSVQPLGHTQEITQDTREAGGDEAATMVDTPTATKQPPNARHPRAHVFAGGGAGEVVMRALADASLPFTLGPLNVGDSDASLGEMLAYQCVLEPPYAPISPQGLAAAHDLARRCGMLIVCPMPVGPGNLALLDLALTCQSEGMAVILLEPATLLPVTSDESSGTDDGERTRAGLAAVAARDFTGAAVARYEALLAAGAHWAGAPSEVSELLRHAPS